MKWKIFIQLLKEFWLQLIISIAWGIYNTFFLPIPNDSSMPAVFIKQFGASLFLVSWFVGQIIRVKKQLNVEGSFKEILTLQNEMINQITSGTNLPALIIGSGTSSRFNDGQLQTSSTISFYVVNGGKYALRDVVCSIQDIYNPPAKPGVAPYDYSTQTFSSIETGAYHHIPIQTLVPKSRKLVYQSKVDSNNHDECKFKIIFEWSGGIYQANITGKNTDGAINFEWEFYDVDGNLTSAEDLSAKINGN